MPSVLLIIFLCCGLESAYWFPLSPYTHQETTHPGGDWCSQYFLQFYWLHKTVNQFLATTEQCPLFSGQSDWGKGAQELWFKNVKVIFILKHSSKNSNKT
jgi:hypothetical protein